MTTNIASPPVAATGDLPQSTSARALSSLDPRKRRIVSALWDVVDQHESICSATLTGSFLTGPGLAGISDIDLVVIVDHLNTQRFDQLQRSFREALSPVLAREKYNLRVNPTLGPLKFNDRDTAVLHLMLYSRRAHVDHVVNSPFTCFDWQLSPVYRKLAMADVYPVFGLQPRHFVSSRRSIRDYLNDYRARVVSYRELQTSPDGYREVRREKPMTTRDRHEFAYHIMRFLMRNLLKLVQRHNGSPATQRMLDTFFTVFPDSDREIYSLYRELQRKKAALDFEHETIDLDRRLDHFVGSFEAQFHRIFQDDATCHILFRHAPTALNGGTGTDRLFLGRSDPPICPTEPTDTRQLAEVVAAIEPVAAFVSPLRRCGQSFARLAAATTLPDPVADPRLLEIDYGTCEQQTVSRVRHGHPDLFAAWQRGEDPPFPAGESTSDVLRRVTSFVEDNWSAAAGNTVACTHNVVLRCLVGKALAVPPEHWYRLQIPHMKPICFVQTRDYGCFVDLDPAVEREIFADFQPPPAGTG